MSPAAAGAAATATSALPIVTVSLAATGPPGSGPPAAGLSPPADGFATVLNDEVARTAPAEGQQKSVAPKQAGRRSHDDDAKASVASVASLAPATPTAPAAPAAPAGGPSAGLPAVAAASAPAPATTAAPTQTLAPAPTTPAAAAGAGDGAGALVATPAANGADTRGAKHDGPPQDPRDGRSAAAPLPSAKAVVGQAVATHAVRAAATTAAAGAATDPLLGTTGITSAARSLPTGAPAAPYGTRLQEAAEAVRSTIELAARQGVTQARIQLSPASLGGVQIHLQHTADGLVARVTADHPEAAQTLAQNGAELRRQLQAGGTTLLRLDIGSSDPRDAGQQSGSGATGSGPSTRGDAGGDDPGAAVVVSTTTEGTLTPLHLGSNALVNLLA